MAKIMLVEDDNNLREIYEARLLAEGYEIVSAKDGEEALALAVKEKPDLIISDVMMPKISGFDMLDILRSTPETRETKVIMMTALSQAEDKTRADKLGADRYLVKSQVTLEDVAKVAKEVLTGETDTPPEPAVEAVPAPSTPTADPGAAAQQAVNPTPVAEPPAEPAAAPAEPAVEAVPAPSTPTADPGAAAQQALNPTPDPAATAAPTAADESAAVADQLKAFEAAPAEAPVATPTEVAADNAATLAAAVNDAMGNSTDDDDKPVEVSGKKIIEPLNDPTAKPDIAKLAAEQEAIDNSTAPVQPPTATSIVTPEGQVQTPPEAATPDAAPPTPDTPPKPGDKIDPNSVAL